MATCSAVGTHASLIISVLVVWIAQVDTVCVASCSAICEAEVDQSEGEVNSIRGISVRSDNEGVCVSKYDTAPRSSNGKRILLVASYLEWVLLL
jgi:hypothetical protein